MKVNNDKILSKYPDIEQFLEEDIITDSYLERVRKQYLNDAKLPQFELIKTIDIEGLSNAEENE